MIERVADRLRAVGEDRAVVLQGERVIGAERHHQGRVEQQRVEIDDDRATAAHAQQQGVARRARQAVEGRLSGALARDRDVEAAAHPVALQQEHDERRQEQHERQRRAAAEVEEAGDLQVSLGRQHRKLVAAQDERSGEVGERRREEQQEGVGEARNGERQRHGAKHATARCTERECHALDVRIDRGEDRSQRQVGDREVRERFGQQRAREAVDRHALQAEEVVGDEAARTEREDHRDRRRERRGDERQQHRSRRRCPGAIAATDRAPR